MVLVCSRVGDNLKMICKLCSIELNHSNACKNGIKFGVQSYRTMCKPCHSKVVMKSQVPSDKRRAYMNAYKRRVGIIKKYSCESCSNLCYKKYARAFCSDICRFIAYIDIQNECWIWNGAKNRKGYGKLSFRGNKTDTAHRVSYKLFNGDIGDKLVCHSCDVPACVNPDHLWLGTHMENMLDMVEKERQSSRLKPIDVFEIRKLWDLGYTQQKIMELFNATTSQISHITKRRSWKHV